MDAIEILPRTEPAMYPHLRFAIPIVAALGFGFFNPRLTLAQPGPRTPSAMPDPIATLLTEHCLDCHSGARPKGGLDLTRAKSAFAGGDNGPALIAGNPEKSLLWQRVQNGEMPPKRALAAVEKERLRKWIEGGAPWGEAPLDPLRFTTRKRAGFDWWALQPIKRPPLPQVKRTDWANNPIDRFILAGLEARGLAPAPPADPRTLLRRVYYDLIGLPPSAEEVDAFVRLYISDKYYAADRSYEELVDRLLASPHYGERWAQHWLDVVRFGESDGFERNGPRLNAWPYRAWVVSALNAGMPYHEFCRLQLAGDVLRPGDVEALKATGFLVAGIHNTVLPMQKTAQETAFQDELEDLVGSVGQTFLGLTVNCGRCHDHKFDPITQKEYYRLASALSGVRHGEREIRSPTAEAALEALLKRIQDVRQQLVDLERPALAAFLTAKEVKGQPGPTPIAAWDFRQNGQDRIGTLHVATVGSARFTPAGLVVDGKTAFARSVPIPRGLRERTLEAWVKLDSLTQRGGGVMTLETPDGAVFDSIVFGEREPGQWLPGSDFFRRTQSLQGPAETDAAHRPVHVALAYHGDGTIAAYRDGKPYGKLYKSNGPVRFEANKAVVVFGMRHDPPGGNRMLAGTIVQARLYDRALVADEIAASAASGVVVPEAEIVKRLTPEARVRRSILRERVADLERDMALQRAALERTRFKVYAANSQQPAATRLLIRGQVTEPGELLAPGALGALASLRGDFGLSADAPEGERRRKLADWISDPQNPLFARVMVNRLWHHHFGAGIVETPNDFGFNGGRPSHPELLDWLAGEFRTRGYRLKEMHRLIVTSNTYRQASTPTRGGLAVDADNRLLWRNKPRRLDAEALRDSMLAAAGLLNREIGGRGFSDFKETSGAGTTYYDPFDPEGPEYHRRSIYRFNPRGHNQGLLDAFDCPDPAAAAPRRGVTTTPLQALALWNGAFALRMADTLAARLATQAPGDLNRQVTLAYQQVLQREPLPLERDLARRLVDQHGVRALARSLFNSNEFLTVE